MSHNPHDCSTCIALGTFVPWALIVVGAVLSVLGLWEETSAYLVAFGILLLATSYILNRLAPPAQRHH